MITADQAQHVQGKPMVGRGGTPLGTVNGLYADREDGHPTFATVSTGGSGTSFVPLEQAELSGDRLTVPYDQDKVAGAPRLDPDSDISEQEEDALYAYYSVGGGPQPATAATPTGTSNEDATTRSEERLQVGTQTREAGRARLRKFVTSEQQTARVPVSTTRATVSSEPITDANRDRAMGGPEMTEAEYEVQLTDEVPVVSKETVPVERVRLGTETVTEQQQVTEQVRKEQVETDGGTAPAAGTPRR